MKHRRNVTRHNTQAPRLPSNVTTHVSRLCDGHHPHFLRTTTRLSTPRPRSGMKLSNWADEEILEGIAQACEYAFRVFCANVITQTQWLQNLIITSTGDKDNALRLAEDTSIRFGTATYELTLYIKLVAGAVCDVVHGITPGTTDTRLMELVAANESCTILHPRMLGKPLSAVITFKGPHVPF